ncbi:hypothetical protein B9T31_17485 [Acinetobacter sp. ANC 4558]|uniref:hypothetical protein n=1 Tax=Acinetobacter sp. ANC 4558 TaxID=1977876 RepID=UPI000A32EF9B|nr:hypothetical protein [Acinetobacter sp. ANC 4558]OTG78504.1 hypothetical protein B9T31_17485 [Acinetobacter sp. ANC 4558]
MDLINQLGGYEKAKNELEKTKNQKYRNFGFLEEALLQYRREHNIFEVGDLVVNDGLIAPHIYSFKKLMPEISMALIMRNGEEGACGLFRLRHATPKEIQAGRRLEVCGG